MERLTKNNKRKLSHGEEIVICKHSENDCNDSCMKIIPCKWYKKAIEKLKRYEDLEEQGRLIKLPCKVGDTVFYINGTLILEYEIVSFSIDRTGAWLMYGEHYVDENDRTYSYNFETDKIGKTVFLTREEAEEKLKEMRGGEHAE